MKSNKKILVGTGIVIGILILFSGSVLSFAVSSAYWKEFPLIISPEETQDISVTLQNMAGADDINLRAAISEISEITAEITDSSDIYLVPAGGKTKVNIKVSIPKEIEAGRYDLVLSFSTVTTSEKGEFGFGSSIEHTLPVEVIGKKSIWDLDSITSSPIYLLIGILIIIILIVMIKKRK